MADNPDPDAIQSGISIIGLLSLADLT